MSSDAEDKGPDRGPDKGPITEDQILKALSYSGFPMEIRLLAAFDKGGFDPMIGHRFMAGEDEPSAEVDIIAYAAAELAGNRGSVHLKALVEAKNLSEGVAFLAYPWKQPTAHQMRSLRIRLSGRPTCMVLDENNGSVLADVMLAGATPLAEALDVLNDAPVCPQWSIVRNNGKNNRSEASKEERYRKSFAKLLRVTTWLERDHALHLARNPGQPRQLRIELLLPTIIVGAPKLYLYDARSETISDTQRLILYEMHEAAGKVYGRYVDVVTEAAVPELMAIYRRAADDLATRCDARIMELVSIAEAQYRWQVASDSEDSEGRPTEWINE